MKPTKTISAYILLAGILGLSIVGAVLIFGVFSALVKTQITGEQAELIKPLNGEIETSLLDDLEKRRRFTEAEMAAQITPTLTPTPTTENVASPGASTNQ